MSKNKSRTRDRASAGDPRVGDPRVSDPRVGDSKEDDRNASSEAEIQGQGAAVAPKTRKPRGLLPPLPQRLCDRASKVCVTAGEISTILAARGAPQEYVEAAATFATSATALKQAMDRLNESGWTPIRTGDKAEIVEGDPIKILDEHIARYFFIDGLAEGRVRLVAGSVDQINKRLAQVMLKDEAGKFYGYCPRQLLSRR